ncbi:MAG: hypothetical protein NPIRA01_37600 [Nitrospirales bacterium]|nr:MAG: hypothetical protein NPIRA01_37600 [Nitrospirales bacterium]
MAMVNFSLPEPVKAAFDKKLAGENKSAVLTQLMQQAVGERERAARRARAIEKLLTLRAKVKPICASSIRRARRLGRP